MLKEHKPSYKKTEGNESLFSASVTTRSPVTKYIIGFVCWFLEYTSNFVLLEDDTARCETEQEGRQ